MISWQLERALKILLVPTTTTATEHYIVGPRVLRTSGSSAGVQSCRLFRWWNGETARTRYTLRSP